MAQKPRDYWINLGLAAIAGMAGCASVTVVGFGLIAGLALDNLFETDYLFTILCIVISVPLSLFVMLFMVIRSARTIQKRQYGTD